LGEACKDGEVAVEFGPQDVAHRRQYNAVDQAA
jgi:hypothetical protein